jgi:hypothetical protein
MHFRRNGKHIEFQFGTVATLTTLFLATYGAGTAGREVANVIVRNLKKR